MSVITAFTSSACRSCRSPSRRVPATLYFHHGLLDDATVDIVISNGVLNLVPDKPAAVREIARVLKPGGRAQIADIVIGEVLPESALRDIDLWTG